MYTYTTYIHSYTLCVHVLHVCRIASIHWTCGRKEPYRDLPPIREPLTALGIRSYDFFAYPSMDYKLIYKYSLYWFFVNLPFYLNIFHIIIHVCMCMYWYMHVSKYYQLTTNVCIARPISSSMQCLCISLSIYRYLPISLSLHVFPYIYLYTRLHTLLYPTSDLSIHLPIYPPTYLLSILVIIFNPILLSTVMYRRFSFHYNRIVPPLPP